MSTFAVKIHQVRAIEPIPGANAIELAVVGDYRSVVRKGQFQPGSQAVYIPEAAMLPASLVEALGLTGRLAGPEKNRVKAVRLRGCLSQGICADPASLGVQGDGDHATTLGIAKWTPPIPAGMAGNVTHRPALALAYDIDNIKAWPDVIDHGEPVQITEKIHGTFCAFIRDAEDGQWYAASKGLLAKGLVFADCEANAHNLYVRALRQWRGMLEAATPDDGAYTYWHMGEVFGRGVQDLHYGADVTRQDGIGFARFDTAYRVAGSHNPDDLRWGATAPGLPEVPLLYKGSFARDVLATLTDGTETVSGRQVHIREGVVVRPLTERRHDELPLRRVQLKSVSAAYLLRGGDATELE